MRNIKGYTLIRVRLTPRSDRNALVRYESQLLYARVTAPPAEGAANRALLSLISKALDVPISRLQIVAGETSRDKLIKIDGLDAAQLRERLQSHLQPQKEKNGPS